MQMRTFENDGSLTVSIEGDIDHHHARMMREEIDARIAEARPKQVILELSQVAFMDSSGLGLILGRLRTVSERGGKLILRDPTPRTERILKMAGVDRLLPIVHGCEADGRRSRKNG